MRRVAITGLGAISALGRNVAEFWHSLEHGCSGIAPMETVDRSKLRFQNGAEVKNYKSCDYFEEKQSDYIDRFAQFALIAAREAIREACSHLKSQGLTDFMSDLTCADFYPREPRFEVAYHLLSMKRKERVRLKVRLSGDEPSVESIVSVWPSVNFFEREIFDLFGIRFLGHPYLRRIMMPEDWEGHPLRKDYPVEGYR